MKHLFKLTRREKPTRLPILMSDLVSTFPLWFCNNCTSIVINTPINAVIALNEIGAGNSANVEACKYNRVLDQH